MIGGAESLESKKEKDIETRIKELTLDGAATALRRAARDLRAEVQIKISNSNLGDVRFQYGPAFLQLERAEAFDAEATRLEDSATVAG